MIILEIAAVIVAGLSNRAGGDDNLGLGKNVDRAIYAACIAYLCGVTLSQSPALIIFYTAAMALSYSKPWSDALDDKDDGPKELIIRGLKGALVLLPVCYWLDVYSTMIAIVIAFATAPYISRFIFESDVAQQFRETEFYERWNLARKERWNLAEIVHGIIASVIVWAL